MRLLWLALAGCLALPLFAQIRNEDSAGKWREDVAVLRREMPRVHANLFQTISRETFTRAVDELEASIPRRADHEIVVEIARIVASIGDGHTFIDFAQPAVGFRMLPVRFYEFKDGVHVRAAASELAELAGAKVLAIEGHPIEDVWRAVAAVTPHENESGLRSMNAVHMAIPEILHGLGISSSKDRVAVRVEQNGKQRDIVLEPRPIMDVGRMKMIDARSENVTPPVSARGAGNFWFRYLEADRLLYVRYNAVYWQKKADGEYQSPGEFFDEVFRFADAHAVDKLVIDVRDNGGGNNTLNLPIVHGIIRRDALNQRGRLFVITGRATFSAAQNFVSAMETHTKALFAGEPTGARPNHYGDPGTIRLPNSGIEIKASTLYWQDVHPADKRDATEPHIRVEASAAEYAAGMDPVLDAVRAFRLLTDVMKSELPKGAEFARQVYARYRGNPMYSSLSTDREMITLAQELVRERRLDDALLIATLNVETYPSSAPAHHARGDVLRDRGAREEAIREYEKAVELEPRNPYHREVLEKTKSM